MSWLLRIHGRSSGRLQGTVIAHDNHGKVFAACPRFLFTVGWSTLALSLWCKHKGKTIKSERLND